jgi:hypothetical protein
VLGGRATADAEFDTRIFSAHGELRQTEKALRKAFKANVAEPELERMLEAAIKKRKNLDTLRYEQLEAAGRTLDVRRRVKLYHFMPKFEREMRRRLRGEGRGPNGRNRGRRGKREGPDRPRGPADR